MNLQETVFYSSFMHIKLEVHVQLTPKTQIKDILSYAWNIHLNISYIKKKCHQTVKFVMRVNTHNIVTVEDGATFPD